MRKNWLGIALLAFLLGVASLLPLTAEAAATSPVCTKFAENKALTVDNTTYKPGMMASIYLYIEETVGNATQDLFEAFTYSSDYKAAVSAAITLMVVIYGAAFTMGVVQASFGQVLIRLIKIGLITALIAPGGWYFFSDYVVRFFSEGTDSLILGVMEIGTGIAPPAGATPFYQLDTIASFLLTPDTVIALLGSMATGGAYGASMASLMMIACIGFIKLLLHTLQKYAICYVARALVLGVAPVFFVFLLFDRTRQLFISWVNVLLNLSLQPLLLFTFLSFFIVLIQTAAKDMFSAELCWTEVQNVAGTQNKTAFWAFVEEKKDADGNTTVQPLTGKWDWNGNFSCIMSGGTSCPEFPVNIINILSFLILVYIAQRFAGVVDRMTTELSNAAVALDATGKFEHMLQTKGRGPASTNKGKADG